MSKLSLPYVPKDPNMDKKWPQWRYLGQSGNIFFYQRLSSTKGHLQSPVVLDHRLSFIKGNLPLKVVFHWSLSSIEGSLALKGAFHWRSSSIQGCLPFKVVFHSRSSSTKLSPYSKFQTFSMPLQVDFGEGCSSSCDSQFLVWPCPRSLTISLSLTTTKKEDKEALNDKTVSLGKETGQVMPSCPAQLSGSDRGQ